MSVVCKRMVQYRPKHHPFGWSLHAKWDISSLFCSNFDDYGLQLM